MTVADIELMVQLNAIYVIAVLLVVLLREPDAPLPPARVVWRRRR